jgi:hypothetical protein
MADSGAEKKGRQNIEKELRNLNKKGKKKAISTWNLLHKFFNKII